MHDRITNFINFILADVKNKKETKELAVLIRLFCLILSIYYIIVGVTIAYLQHYYLGLLLIGAIALLVGTFMCTYEDHTAVALVMLNLIIFVFSTLLALYVGFDMDFHIPIFLNILLIYFNKTDTMKLKHIYTVAICTYLMCVTQFCEATSHAVVSSSNARIFIQSLNMLLISLAIGSTAYSYCMKFNQAEEKLRRINENLERMANIDTLTGLSNRRHMNEHLAQLEYDFNRSQKAFTLAIGDVDFFKKVNDTYGHDTGDYVLSTLSGIFTTKMKGRGHVARWGGEEFLFSFENMSMEKAYLCLDDIRRTIEATPMHFKEYDFNVTMSYGMEEYNDRLGIESTITKADNKLYKAKTTGRNKVVI